MDTEVRSVELLSGQHIHNGPESTIERQLSKTDPLPNAVIVQLSCAGTTIFCSSNVQLWSRIGRETEPFFTPVFIVGFYFGKGRPFSVSDFLKECISELNMVLRDNIQVGTNSVGCTLSSVICNTLARAFIRQVKGYFGCDRCIHRRLCWDKRVTFFYVKCKTRDANSFCPQRQFCSLCCHVQVVKLIFISPFT